MLKYRLIFVLGPLCNKFNSPRNQNENHSFRDKTFDQMGEFKLHPLIRIRICNQKLRFFPYDKILGDKYANDLQ